jgi:hypothetical protein
VDRYSFDVELSHLLPHAGFPGAHNKHRPHRSLQQRPPIQEAPPGSETVVALDRVRHRDVLGALIHENEIAA